MAHVQESKNKAAIAVRDAKAAKADVKAKRAAEEAERKAELRAAREKEKLRRARRGPKPQMGAVAEARLAGTARDDVDGAAMCALLASPVGISASLQACKLHTVHVCESRLSWLRAEAEVPCPSMRELTAPPALCRDVPMIDASLDLSGELSTPRGAAAAGGSGGGGGQPVAEGFLKRSPAPQSSPDSGGFIGVGAEDHRCAAGCS